MSAVAVRPEIDHEMRRDLEYGGGSWPLLWSRVEAVKDAQRALWAQEEGAEQGTHQAARGVGVNV